MEVLRFFKHNGTGYVVLRYEQGRTLKQRLDEGPLAESELRHMLDGLLDGLEALHAEAILHSDIKPSNIILSDSRVPGEREVRVLIDFGTVRDFRSRHSRTTIVASGYAPPGYAPLERYTGGQAGPWSDLYALGATAYRCVTGQVPPEAVRRLRKDPYVPAVEAAAGRYDEGLLALIDRMLSVDEVDRPQSAAEVREALNARGATPRGDVAPLQASPSPVVKRSLIDAVAAGFVPVANRGDMKSVNSVAFSPDGLTLASGSYDHRITLWEVASGQELRTLEGHENIIHSVAFSSDGRTLASGSADGTIILWSVADGTIQTRFIGKGTLGSIVLDGKGLPIAVTGDEDAVYHFVKDGKTIKPSEMRAMGYDLPAPSPVAMPAQN
jgi:serine/threonine protein kinase